MTTTTVFKVGGNAFDALPPLADDERAVVVHGGGPQITAELARRCIPSVFAHGRRVTTPETMAVVRTVLLTMNTVIVSALGPRAIGVTDVLTATELDPALGLVGEVAAVDTPRLTALLDAGRVPVVATVASGTDGTPFNVNADTAAAAIAVALGADRAEFVTDVAGLYADPDDPATLIPHLTTAALADLLPRLTGGMVPKMEACLRAVRGGVPYARVGATTVTP